jgi:hypothetical protein
VTLSLASDVPASWTLLGSSFTATAGGVPVSGAGTVVGDPYPWALPPPGDGFQRIWLADVPRDYAVEDSGEITLEFPVNDVPPGEFVLKFRLVASGDVTGSTREYTAVTVNRKARPFAFGDALFPVDGVLDEMPATAVAPDGRTMILGGYR